MEALLILRTSLIGGRTKFIGTSCKPEVQSPHNVSMTLAIIRLRRRRGHLSSKSYTIVRDYSYPPSIRLHRKKVNIRPGHRSPIPLDRIDLLDSALYRPDNTAVVVRSRGHTGQNI